VKLAEYISGLQAEGTTVYYPGREYFWMSYEKKAAARSPAFVLDNVDQNEVKEVFKRLAPVFITYNIESTEKESNAFLYVSRNYQYDMEKLDKNARRFTRTAHKNFQFRFTDWDNILKNAYPAFADTRARNGLSDGTIENFQKIFNECKKNPAFKTIAAFLPGDEKIHAFLQITEVEDWVEITSAYSENDYLRLCPNNGLFDTAFSYYLKEQRAKVVSYGVSSIQKASKKDTLHDFKLRIGFDAVPVKRVFAVNPKYRPFINKYSYGIVKLLLKMFPHDRRMNKLEGVMSAINEEAGG
jgi:hypothetical protein